MVGIGAMGEKGAAYNWQIPEVSVSDASGTDTVRASNF